MNQKSRILRHLETYGSITPIEALQDYGVYRLGARIFDLRKDGHAIRSETVTGENRFGERTAYAKYILENEK